MYLYKLSGTSSKTYTLSLHFKGLTVQGRRQKASEDEARNKNGAMSEHTGTERPDKFPSPESGAAPLLTPQKQTPKDGKWANAVMNMRKHRPPHQKTQRLIFSETGGLAGPARLTGPRLRLCCVLVP